MTKVKPIFVLVFSLIFGIGISGFGIAEIFKRIAAPNAIIEINRVGIPTIANRDQLEK